MSETWLNSSPWDAPEEEEDEGKRFLRPEDCTWLGDPERLDDPDYDPTQDPRYGKIHQAQWDAVCRICENIGVKDAERDYLLLTARQAAKSTTELLAAIKTATERPRSRTLYVSFDLATGNELIYEPAQQWLDKLGWSYKPVAGGPSGLRIKLENGSIIQCRSADDLRAVGRLRGRGWHLVLGDEIQDMLHVAEKLFETVLGPTTLRFSGVMVLAFTPPDIQAGWLWDQYTNGAWVRLGWSMEDNPFLPPGAARRWLEKRGMSLDHPTAQREILGKWISNKEKQVYDGFDFVSCTYDPVVTSTDEYAKLPDGIGPKDQWVYTFGSDLGWEHDTSIVFLAWNLHDARRRIFEVFTWVKNKQGLEEISEVLLDLYQHFRPWRTATMDQAGAGGQIILNSVEAKFRKWGIPIRIKYKPANVVASVSLVNDAFRTGKLMLRKDSILLHEIPKTVWLEGSNRSEIDKASFDPHGLDGLRYGVWGATNWKAEGQDPDPTKDPDPQRRREAELAAYLAAQEAQRKRGRWR